VVDRVTLGEVSSRQSGTGTGLCWPVALGEVFIRVLEFSAVRIIQQLLQTHSLQCAM
jgi:hypothetical protein